MTEITGVVAALVTLLDDPLLPVTFAEGKLGEQHPCERAGIQIQVERLHLGPNRLPLLPSKRVNPRTLPEDLSVSVADFFQFGKLLLVRDLHLQDAMKVLFVLCV